MMNNYEVLNYKIKDLAKLCFKNEIFGYDFIKKVLISITLKKPYYITVHNLHINALKSILKIFVDFNFFNIDMNHVENINDIAGFKNQDGTVNTIGFAPKAEMVFLDNIWNTNSNLIRTISDLISTNSYHVDNLIIDSQTKVFIGTASLEQRPNLKYDRLWNAFFIKDQYISKIKDLDDVLNLDNIQFDEKLSQTDLTWINQNFEKVLIPRKVFEIIGNIHERIALANLPFENKNHDFEHFLFDELTWKNIIRAIKINAMIDGRNYAENQDLKIIAPIVCALPIQYDIVEKIIKNAIGNSDGMKEDDFDFDKEIETIANISNQMLDDVTKIGEAKTAVSYPMEKTVEEKQKQKEFLVDEIKNKIEKEISNFKKEQKVIDAKVSIEPIKPIEKKPIVKPHVQNQRKIIQQDTSNNRPRIYNENDALLKAKEFLSQPQDIIQEPNIEAIAVEHQPQEKTLFGKKMESFFEKPIEQPQKLEQDDKIKKLESIAFGSYASYRQMVFKELEDIEVKNVQTVKKVFRNEISTFYLANDQYDQTIMIDVKSFDKINHQKNQALVFICSKNDFMANEPLKTSTLIHYANKHYYLKDGKNKNNLLTFELKEAKNDLITPNFISIHKTQRFIQEGKFLMDHFESVSSKIRNILNSSKNNTKEHNQAIESLTNITLVKGKIKSFNKWIKNSNAYEGSIRNFLPEYSSI